MLKSPPQLYKQLFYLNFVTFGEIFIKKIKKIVEINSTTNKLI